MYTTASNKQLGKSCKCNTIETILQVHNSIPTGAHRKCIDVIKGQSLSDGGSWRKKLLCLVGEIFVLRRRVNILKRLPSVRRKTGIAALCIRGGCKRCVYHLFSPCTQQQHTARNSASSKTVG